MKKALITGITGQDGSYLAELLLSKGYEVHGLVRRSSSVERTRLDALHLPTDSLHLHYGDLGDSASLQRILYEVAPDEVYNLAAQSHVRISFDVPEYTTDVVATGTVRLLEAIRAVGLIKKVRFYQASSSEMFGKVQEIPQSETTPFWPRSPYACGKVCSHWMTVNYRESYGMHASSGILFNHESPRRGENFVTRKITRTATRIKEGLEDRLVMGNLDSKRDWGYAKEYVEGMWRMLQQDTPGDYVLATGETRTVQEFVEATFGYLNLDWKDYVTFDERFVRPAEVDLLIGNPSKAKKELGWVAETRFQDLANLMTESDWALAKSEAARPS
ncbi:GDP-mannose 4,6-dehydratase [Puniceicoccaceae bacterium]|nr:GDP-mannose 4,6-dehydratase [Puniceicoccaceae bacterium]